MIDYDKLYIDRKYDQRGNFVIVLVDGEYIRKYLDEEFTNFGQHYRQRYIPENEFWIDEATDPSERVFFIDHLLVENRLMSEGDSYDFALKAADVVEKRERRRSDVSIKPRLGSNSYKSKLVKIKQYEFGNPAVWIVDGKKVRDIFNIDFVEGGHDLVYNFIPKGEIWIDNVNYESDNFCFILAHEEYERKLMADGMEYHNAHSLASKHEHELRMEEQNE